MPKGVYVRRIQLLSQEEAEARLAHYNELKMNWRTKNKQRIADYNKQYFAENQSYFKNIEKHYYDSNLNYRIAKVLRARINAALSRGIKSLRTTQLLGCSITELTVHIEHQFADGMTWQNYGAWHIDHIRPCASFDLTKQEEQKLCFNYKNLQPLWAVDNMRKGAKYAYC